MEKFVCLDGRKFCSFIPLTITPQLRCARIKMNDAFLGWVGFSLSHVPRHNYAAQLVGVPRNASYERLWLDLVWPLRSSRFCELVFPFPAAICLLLLGKRWVETCSDCLNLSQLVNEISQLLNRRCNVVLFCVLHISTLCFSFLLFDFANGGKVFFSFCLACMSLYMAAVGIVTVTLLDIGSSVSRTLF